MRSFFVLAFICVFLTAACSAQSKIDLQKCMATLKETLNVVEDILKRNEEVFQSAEQIANRFGRCIRVQQNFKACIDLITPDLKNLKELFETINQDTPRRISDKVKDIIKNCRRQFFLEVIQTAFLA